MIIVCVVIDENVYLHYDYSICLINIFSFIVNYHKPHHHLHNFTSLSIPPLTPPDCKSTMTILLLFSQLVHEIFAII